MMATPVNTVVFDDHGHSWDAASYKLRCMLGCPAPDFDFLDFVINNLGFVTLSVTRSGACQIKLRPILASPQSLAAALFALADRNPERVIVSYPDGDCRDELFASVGKAVERIAQLASKTSSDSPRFMRDSRQIDELADRRHPLSALFSVWRESGKVFDAADHADLLDGLLGGRFMTVSRTVDRLTMDIVGQGFVSHDEKWRVNAVGRPLEDQPDYDYGLWARDMFRSVLEQGKPRLDDIDAKIRRPYFDDEVRVRYRCLILPYQGSATRELRLLCASVVDEAINLRGTAPTSPLTRQKSCR